MSSLSRIRVDEAEQAGDDDRQRARPRPGRGTAGRSRRCGARSPRVAPAARAAGRRRARASSVRPPPRAAARPKVTVCAPSDTERSTMYAETSGDDRRSLRGPNDSNAPRTRDWCHRPDRCLRQPCIAHPTASHGTQHTTRRRGHHSASGCGNDALPPPQRLPPPRPAPAVRPRRRRRVAGRSSPS